MAKTPETIDSLDQISSRYKAIICDVWGVLHNGITHSPDAAAALARARDGGMPVVLITNAPRPCDSVIAQIEAIGVPGSAWDSVVTSGDVTRDLIRQAPRKIFHLGPDRDTTLYDGLDVELVEEFEASVVVCTGFFDDDLESPDDYVEMLRRLRARDLSFICANPDIVVERGEKLVWCAGALARDYALIGGRTQIAGKPHAPIYEAALKAVSERLGRGVERGEVLAIGDGMLTDIKGAADNGFDALYISGGIHAADYGHPDQPDPERLAAFLEKHGFQPVAVMPKLR
ncbi:MAG: TIGR01459 family HAD-type hydrolase [Alphaproteobacteria bacterium]|nr:TIGR01459 family HAD-type hydrolase [Alphaproteobacteria bacterium]MBU0805907.1 TIGR01459 family HAD-type hydrolase [Alphaproteobacteria bacterium]MBU0874124.1 TIGR01459 family HAD-type hydrolase [Alphaproteobacteria bacterium]MBU1402052.1 TIGR01459 family HAD-type hydrolase [Alphaproteobacteria bacterium]MBU1590697.1 TIGR01459 family HAD-type hydrolase [Alphaproteobacteria bacterium]